MAIYNITGIANKSTSALTLIQEVNRELTGGLFVWLLIAGIGVIAFISFYNVTKDAGRALAPASFFMFSLSFIFATLDLVPDLFVYISLVVMAASVAFYWRNLCNPF